MKHKDSRDLEFCEFCGEKFCPRCSDADDKNSFCSKQCEKCKEK